jgi:hypothetical protein
MRPNTRVIAFVLFCCCAFGSAAGAPILADHEACAAFDLVPDSLFGAIRANLRIFYGHTSHGSQIVSGLDMLGNESALYAKPAFYEISDDLGHSGDTSWVPPTRSFLDAHPDYNVAMWSWCGGVSDNTEAGIDAYLTAMSDLESDYPDVVFVYMTGHLDSTGPSGNLYLRNNQIRSFCAAHEKILFDFADIESWDPDGNGYPWETDACHWCSAWCAAHDCPGCPYCAHSHCFNCYQKGKAWWWMAARILGWDETTGARAPNDGPAPAGILLRPNRPNPFNPETEIAFSLPAAGQARLSIHDAAGRLVALLADRPFDSVEQVLRWDGRDEAGGEAPSGVYFARLAAGEFTASKKMVLLR